MSATNGIKPAAWMTEGHHVCPSWCIGDHFTGDAYEDRTHESPMTAVTLTATDQAHGEDPGFARPGAEGLPHINMCLTQHYREERPRIWVGKGGSSNGFHLTEVEAEWLASELQDLVRDNEQSRREAREREEPGGK
jgi:hypothetical protein